MVVFCLSFCTYVHHFLFHSTHHCTCSSNYQGCLSSTENTLPVFQYTRLCLRKLCHLLVACKIIIEHLLNTSFLPFRLLVAIVAFTIEACKCINAFVVALMHLDFGTFIHIAMKWLIGFVFAVRYFIAHQSVVNTFTIVASKLCGADTC